MPSANNRRLAAVARHLDGAAAALEPALEPPGGELHPELAKRGVNTKDEAIAKLLLNADTDGDGEISLKELLDLCKKFQGGKK